MYQILSHISAFFLYTLCHCNHRLNCYFCRSVPFCRVGLSMIITLMQVSTIDFTSSLSVSLLFRRQCHLPLSLPKAFSTTTCVLLNFLLNICCSAVSRQVSWKGLRSQFFSYRRYSNGQQSPHQCFLREPGRGFPSWLTPIVKKFSGLWHHVGSLPIQQTHSRTAPLQGTVLEVSHPSRMTTLYD